jgi:hypothetical protein
MRVSKATNYQYVPMVPFDDGAAARAHCIRARTYHTVILRNGTELTGLELILNYC